jgi:hypothetical protein
MATYAGVDSRIAAVTGGDDAIPLTVPIRTLAPVLSLPEHFAPSASSGDSDHRMTRDA